MKKILIGLIAFALVVWSSSALAWDVDVTIAVENSKVDLTATATSENYVLSSAAGVDGTGQVGIHGEGDDDSGHMITAVSGTGEMYAANGLGSNGCLIDCVGEACEKCPDYEYGAVSSARIHGQGEIILAQAAGYDINAERNANAQILVIRGQGDFTTGMMSSLWITGMDEPVNHAMGAFGTNVVFYAFGVQGMDTETGENAGWFTADLNFLDEGCEEGDDCDPPVFVD